MDYIQFVSAHPSRRVRSGHVLSISGIDAVKKWFLNSTPRHLDIRHLQLTPQLGLSTNSMGVINVEALHMTQEGVQGQYQGNLTWRYAKVSLSDLIPYPIRYAGPYPAQWGYIRYWLETTYGLCFDANDLMLVDSAVALKDSDYIETDYIGPDQYFELMATSNSLRFRGHESATPLRLILTPTGNPDTSLKGHSWGTLEGDMRILVDPYYRNLPT